MGTPTVTERAFRDPRSGWRSMKSARGEIMELSGRAGDQGGGVIGGCPINRQPTPWLSVASSLSTTVCRRDRYPSSRLALSVSLSAKLRVTGAHTEHMPFYLRVFFRLLSSWVHGEKSWSL